MNTAIPTSDGSATLYSSQFGQTYHSTHGAITESQRVFIELGLEYVAETKTSFQVLEMGFGTGLNALLTWREADTRRLSVDYTTLEAYPIGSEELARLNYDAVLQTNYLQALHEAPWGRVAHLGPDFSLQKLRITLDSYLVQQKGPQPVKPFDLVYFDAFSPDAQPELWTPAVFSALARRMAPSAVLTTYSAKGSVRRALVEAGFSVEKHPGPPGKREVVRAIVKSRE